MTEGTKIEFDKKMNRKLVETNEELREIFKEMDIRTDLSPSYVIKEVCDEFITHGIELPNWTRGINQVIPIKNNNVITGSDFNFPVELLLLKTKFEKLKIEYIRAKWI